MALLNNKLRWISLWLIFGFWILSFGFSAWAEYPSVRIKDIARVLEARENQLMGFGLVAGLRNTGDSYQTEFTKLALTNLLSRLGIAPQNKEFRSRNVAAVMVTCNLPAFVKPGTRIDVTVSSLGDGTSLKGGTLLSTPLEGPDGEIYAVVQGPVSIGSIPETHLYRKGVLTVGKISGGALVEKEVPVKFGSENILTIVLNQPDFTTASRVAYTITKAGFLAKARDAATILVPYLADEDPIELMAKIEALTIVPDVAAKVVINERTGTIVIGENVKLAPVAVTYRSFTVVVGEGEVMAERGTGSKLTEIKGAGNLGDLVKALNAVGASPADLIAILQAIKAAGAITGELEII